MTLLEQYTKRVGHYSRFLDVAKDCRDNLMMDTWPRPAAICDFGLDSTEHYGSLQHAVRSGATIEELCVVLGEGAKITELCRRYKDNPYGSSRYGPGSCRCACLSGRL